MFGRFDVLNAFLSYDILKFKMGLSSHNIISQGRSVQ